MSEPKILITQNSLDRIRYLRDHGASINSIAHTKGWPNSLIKRICEGVDVEYFVRKPKRDNRKAKKGMCTCCNIRPVEEDFRYLCLFCWQNEDDDIEEHSIGVI